MLRNGIVNSSRLTGEVWVEGTHDDARMIRLLLVEPEKVLAIQSDDGALLFHGIGEHLIVRYRASGIARLLDREDIVTQAA